MRVALSALVVLTALACGCAWPWQQNSSGKEARLAEDAALRNWVATFAVDPEHAGPFHGSNGTFSSSSYYHNLGNACLLAGKLAEAIYNYHRGLRLDPNDAGLQANLDYARAKVQYPFRNRGQPEVDSWPPWLYRPTPFQMLAAATICYVLACLYLTRGLIRGGPPVTKTIALVLLAAACGFYWLRLESQLDWQDRHALVVIRDDKLPFRQGNGPSYPANPELPLLARGMEARTMSERGGWLQIQFASGEVGWVEKSAVLVDQP